MTAVRGRAHRGLILFALVSLVAVSVLSAVSEAAAPQPKRVWDPPGLRTLESPTDFTALGIPEATAWALSLSAATDPTAGIAGERVRVVKDGVELTPPRASGGDPQPPPATAAAEGTPFELQETFAHETPRGYSDLLALPAAGPSAFVRVHEKGAVYAMNDAKTRRWYRPAMSFYADWEVEGARVVPNIHIGVNAGNPFGLVSENPASVGDVTGDGFDDVVVSHYVWYPDLAKGSYVSVLDGRDGHTVWWQRFVGYVMHVVLAEMAPTPGLEIVVTQEPDPVLPRGKLAGVVQALDPNGILPLPLWVHTTGLPSAFVHADRVQDQPPLIALSVANVPVGVASPKKGEFLVLDGLTGLPVWKKDLTGYVRTFRADRASGTVVVHEMKDPGLSGIDWAYKLRAYDVKDGTQTTGETGAADRTRALMIPLEVGDADGDPGSEWVVAELALHPVLNQWGSTRVLVIDPGPVPSIRWTYEVPQSEMETPLGLEIVPGVIPRVVVTEWKQYREPHGVLSLSDSTFAVEGSSMGAASLAWRIGDQGTMPTWTLQTRVGGEPAVLMSQTGLTAWAPQATDPAFQVTQYGSGAAAYRADDGARVADVEVLAEPLDALTTRVNGDTTEDVIVGGTSGVVFAWDGRGLDPIEPRKIWATPVQGPVRELVLANVVGDATPEVVVAASTRVAVLRLSDGKVLWSHVHPTQRRLELWWTVGVGDVDGDGLDDVVVPGHDLRALDGATGEGIWTYDPTVQLGDPPYFSDVVLADVDGDGADDVGAEYTIDLPGNLAPRHILGVVAVCGSCGQAVVQGAAAEAEAPPAEVLWDHVVVVTFGAHATLWNSVVSYDTPTGPRFSFSYNGSLSLPNPLAFQGVRLDVYDARTGEMAWTPLASGCDQHTQTIGSPRGGDELFDFNWYGICRATPQGWTRVETPDGRHSPWNGTFAELLPGEEHLILGGRDFSEGGMWISVYPSEVAWGSGPIPARTAGYIAQGAEFAEIVDMNDDGVDEIIALPFDLEGYGRIQFFQGVSLFGGGVNLPKGIAILKAVPTQG